MNLLLTVLTLIVAFQDVLSVPPPFQQEIKEFNLWMIQFGITFETAGKQYKALYNFIRNWNIIVEHNKRYDMGLTEFKMATNQFAGSSPEEMTQVNNGTRIPVADFNDSVRPKGILTVDQDTFPPGPASVDWSAAGHVTSIKDQGYVCNSCWAFSAVAALETALSINFGRLVNISTQYLIDCNRNSQTGNFGCSGGSIASAYMNIQYSPGIPSWETYPYQELTTHQGTYQCRYKSSTSVGRTTGYGRIPSNDEETMARVVATTAIVCAMNSELDTFAFYKSGIYNDPQCKPGTAHSIVIVGYSSVRLKNGTVVEYWICKNSWSAQWGNQGYFRLIKGRNMCGISAYCVYPLVT